MLDRHMHKLARDEAGGGTIMGLFWFVLLIGILGLAVDATNGERNETMLQATADSAALAAAIDLPDETATVKTASDYAKLNMEPEEHGYVLDPKDVLVGEWDPATPAIDTESANPDSVMVTVWRGDANTNALPMHFLRIIGLESWNVRAQAAAQRYIPDCLRDGLIARRHVEIKSENEFTNDICIHGKKGVHISSENYFEPGVAVSMLDLDTLEVPDSGMDSNTGLEEALRESGLDPRMVNDVDEIMDSFLEPATSPYLPAYIDPEAEVEDVPRNKVSETDFKPGHVYQVLCDGPNQTAEFANQVVEEVVIVFNCRMTSHSNVVFSDVVLASRNEGAGDVTNYNVEINGGVQFGARDDCAPGGGVQIFSNASMKFHAKATFDGVQMVAAGNIDLAAEEKGVNGISAQAGLDIDMTSKNMFGLCDGGIPNLFTAWYYRLVL